LIENKKKWNRDRPKKIYMDIKLEKLDKNFKKGVLEKQKE